MNTNVISRVPFPGSWVVLQSSGTGKTGRIAGGSWDDVTLEFGYNKSNTLVCYRLNLSGGYDRDTKRFLIIF